MFGDGYSADPISKRLDKVLSASCHVEVELETLKASAPLHGLDEVDAISILELSLPVSRLGHELLVDGNGVIALSALLRKEVRQCGFVGERHFLIVEQNFSHVGSDSMDHCRGLVLDEFGPRFFGFVSVTYTGDSLFNDGRGQ